MAARTFSQVVSDAINDLSLHGFDDIGRLSKWQREIEVAAEREIKSENQLTARLKDHLSKIYAQRIERGGVLKLHNIPRWTLEKIKPKLRNELDRRIIASAQLIKLNREEMIQKTLRRFSGWATSLPMGGSDIIDKREVAADIKKSLYSENFVNRRLLIDQSHKFKAALDNIIATDGGAIAAEWNVRRTAGYDNRHSHLEREGNIYLMRDSWAMKEGLVKLAGHQYTDEITQPGEEISCSCNFRFIYALRDIPHECLTNLAKEKLAK